MKMRLSALATSAAVLFSTLVPAAADAATTTAADLPALLTVAAETSTPKYDRARFEHWIDADGDGCNTRYEVLIEESTTPVSAGAGCSLVGGTWVSPYDGFSTSDVTRIQIDHVVALAEAWRSGASAWTDAERRAFANDITVPFALTAASDLSNQAKADHDPARWLPTNGAFVCEYVTSWALVKYRWSLTVDEPELAALRSVLAGGCGQTAITLPDIARAATVPTPPVDDSLSSTIADFGAGVTRLAGISRYETAISVSKRYSPGVKAVFVATGLNFPDALSAAAAAAYLGGPLLLTPPTKLDAGVRDEIRRLAPETIYIAGDTGAVSSSVERALASIASVERLGGLSRYETGNAIVGSVFSSAMHAFIATGTTFPDALAASGAAGSTSSPVILVDGTKGSVPAATTALLSGLGVTSVTIAGGTGAISSGIESQLSRVFATTRIGGASRYETAANINDAFFEAGAPAAFLATGLNFPDALAGAALAGRMKSPVYVTATSCVPEAAHTSLQRLGARSTVALGGVDVVNQSAAANLECLTAAVPTISGSTVAGSRLTAHTGTWTSGTSFSYQWLAGGIAIAGATGPTLSLTSAMVGKRISVRVNGSLSGYAPRTVTSGTTSYVTSPGPTTPPPPPAPPTSTSPSGWDCPSWVPIKGNANSMIYHVPGGAYYSRTKPEECFSTEAAAKAAGYRKSQR